MDSLLPSFNQITEFKDRLAHPALGVLKPVKDYIDSRKSPRGMDRNTEIIELKDLSRREADFSKPSIDHQYSQSGEAQRQRVQRLLEVNSCRALVQVNTSAPSPVFPSELPNRPKPKTTLNRWKLGFFGLLLVLLASAIPLALLLARRSGAPEPVRHQERFTVTERVTATETDTTTRWNTSISTTMRLTVSYETITSVSIRTSTYTESKTAKTTGIGSDCNNLEFFLAKKY
jgi:hypothetical protein